MSQLEEGKWQNIAWVPSAVSGSEEGAIISRGFKFDRDRDHQIQVVLNNACHDEIRSEVMPLILVHVDLDIDSDNNNGFDPDWPRTETEENIENVSGETGKIVSTNNGDFDNDTVPDFADGFSVPDKFDNAGPDASTQFTPLKFELSQEIDLSTSLIKFIYSESDPTAVDQSDAGTPEDPYVYTLPGEGHLRLWKKDGLVSRSAEEISVPTGDFIKSDTPYNPADLGLNDDSRTITLYVEGVQMSESLGDQIIYAEVMLGGDSTKTAGDMVRVTVAGAYLVPDYNRDKVIDNIDEALYAQNTTFYFWLNNDNDNGSEMISWKGYDDVSNPSGFFTDRKNNEVDGKRDLIDFFSVRVSVPPVIFDDDNIKLVLKTDSGAVKIVYTTISSGDQAGYYLTDPTTAEALQKAKTYEVNAEEDFIINNADFLKKLKDDGQATLIVEGHEPILKEVAEAKGLTLTIRDKAKVLYTTRLNLRIDNVEEMFRHKNFIDEPGEDEEDYPDRDETPNLPNDDKCDKDLVFLHGFNINAKHAKGWQAEFFKKMFWSGSNARFHGITWLGSEGQMPVPTVGHKTTEYHTNVVNAFKTAKLLREYLKNKNLVKGEVILAAHSLGNMVACEAIKSEPNIISRYFMLNAALPAEAIDAAIIDTVDTDHENMLHKDWIPYEGITKLYASEWHSLFTTDEDDKRTELTWNGRYSATNITSKIINMYSSGDQVFEFHPKDNAPGPFEGIWNGTFAKGRLSWALQEKLKGENSPDLLSPGTDYTFSHYAGWGFNDQTPPLGWAGYTPEQAAAIPEATLQTTPFFNMGEGTFQSIFSDAGDFTASNNFLEEQDEGYEINKIHRIIAGAIPAMSLAAGRVNINKVVNKNMNEPGEGDEFLKPDFYPYRGNQPWQKNNWFHADINNQPYLYTNKVFNYLVTYGGGLK